MNTRSPNATEPAEPAAYHAAGIERETFLAAMRKGASSVCVVATEGPAGRYGVTVSAMTSVTADPPAVLVCIRGDNLVIPAIAENGTFCVNMLSPSHMGVSEVFAGRSPGRDRFSCGDWITLATGSPALVGASAVFDCRLAQSHSFGTHALFIGEVVAVDFGAGEPLVYHDRNYCRVAAMQ